MFEQLARKCAAFVGSKYAFMGALFFILLWGLSGPFMKFSETWQLIANTATTLVTFTVVFLIQNSQNHDTRAMHLKLDELILKLKDADDDVIEIENKTQEALEEIRKGHHA
jgi:low affinity Fe/Cu permease